MTNYEYYNVMLLDDIKHYEKEKMNSLQILTELNKNLHFCNKYDFSMIGAYMEWLKKEYKPPYKITEFEKIFLENLSKDNKKIRIIRCGSLCDLVIYKNGKGNEYCYLNSATLFGFNLNFEYLVPDVKYNIKDILSNYVLVKE